MSKSKAPPPINPVKNKPFKMLPKPPSGMKEVELKMTDAFAPSYASYYTTSDDTQSPLANHLFYNQQLYDTMYVAMDEAISAGLPPIDHNFPLQYAVVSDDALRFIFSAADVTLQRHPRGSFTWLCVQVYIRWALLCHSLSDSAAAKPAQSPEVGENPERTIMRQRAMERMMGMDHAFFLGAALRELELTVLNRKDAIRGKVTVESARAGGNARKGKMDKETQERMTAMKGFVESGHSIANSARLVAARVGGTMHSNKKLWERAIKK